MGEAELENRALEKVLKHRAVEKVELELELEHRTVEEGERGWPAGGGTRALGPRPPGASSACQVSR